MLERVQPTIYIQKIATDFIHKHEYIVGTLKTLLDADMIDAEQVNIRKASLDSRRFRIPVGLTRRWLLREHPLELVRKKMHG